ncbi:MAG TPA: universal stress protein [Hyphomicrobiaceae bacterium]|jgi:nucleotide-binding universal stress UspA family protein|nr:universal stress protein [Hyphomicrobiaceae bacterium]
MAASSSTEKPNNILLATDLTPACDRALDRAVQLAIAWDAALTVCHVVEASSLRPWGVERRVKNAETEMQRLVARNRSSLKERLSCHVLVGDPAEGTIEYARSMSSDFLITGPAHSKTLGDKLLGSTAARILRRAQRPVLAVRRREEGPYRAVVVAVDFSRHSQEAFHRARALFRNAQSTLVHAYQVTPEFGGSNADKSMDVVEAEEKARVIHAAKQDMADLYALGEGQTTSETVLEQGSPEAVLTAYVERHWPDLVVTGTHGRSGAQQAVIGSVAEGLLQSLPCDVLAVPASQ